MNERTAPTGKLWANVEDSPLLVGLVMSQECALDKLDPLWETYPSWPNYPDERNLPVGIEARRQWALRRPLRLAELARRAETKPVTKPPVTKLDVTKLCPVCNTPLPEKTGRPATYCSPKCRVTANRKKTLTN